MTKCNSKSITLAPLLGRKTEVSFTGSAITSNAGILLLREADKKIALTKELSTVLHDVRDPHKIKHSQLSMLRQRIYSICCAYEYLNDQDHLRFDACLQIATGQLSTLASKPTLSRLENSYTREDCAAVHNIMFEQFIAQQHKAPTELVLDFDATDDAIHGDQEGKYFNGYYDQYCFMPLYVFCQDQLLVSYLRPSNIDGAKHAWAILALLVKGFRKIWPDVKIIFRGDAGFCRHKMLSWCERHGVEYIVGMAKNSCLMRYVKTEVIIAQIAYEATHMIQRRFCQFDYAAKSWKETRRMVARIQYDEHGASVRLIITNRPGQAKTHYEQRYCQRGNMENMIKQQKLDLFSDRTSCHDFIANQMRLLLSSMAYVLLNAVQRMTLGGKKKFKHAYINTLRNAFLKIGAVIIINTRRIKILIDSHYPYQALFATIARKLAFT